MSKPIMPKLKLVVPAGVLLLLAALYGGYKGYIHYQVSSELDRLIALAAPFAHISYGGITSTLDGRLTVEQIRVIPQGVPDEAHIDAIGVRGDGPLFLLRLLSGAKSGEPPTKLNFFARGIRMALNGEFAAQYTGLLRGFRQPGGPAPDSCDFGGWVSPEGFRAQGMDAFLLDLDAGYSFGPGVVVQARVEVGVQGVETTGLEMTLAGVPQPGAALAGAAPRVEDFTLRYALEPEFAAAALGRCAQARGQTPEAYVEALFASERQLAQAVGFVPGPGLGQALKTFLKQPERILINGRLPPGFDPATLGLYAPAEWAGILGLEVEINGQPVTDLSFALAPTSAGDSWLATLTGADRQPVTAPVVTAEDSPEQARRIKREYRATPVASLRDHVGKEVRLYTTSAEAPRTGALRSIDQAQATVEQHVHGGRMAVHVPLSEIVRAEVWLAVE